MVKTQKIVWPAGESLEQLAVEWVKELGRQTGAFAVTSTAAAANIDGDFLVKVRPCASPSHLSLTVEVRSRATPQTVLPLVLKAEERTSQRRRLLCSPAISPHVAEMCRAHGVGYLDAAGNCHLEGPGLFVHIEGRKNKYPDTRGAVDLFAPKSSRMIRVMLSQPRRGWLVQEIGAMSQISLGLASRIKQGLSELALIETRERKIFLSDPERLLKMWSDSNPANQRSAYYMLGTAEEIEERLERWLSQQRIPHAWTEFSGAWRTTPHVRYNFATCLIDRLTDARVRTIQEELGARSVDSGANLFLSIPNDEFAFHDARKIGQLQIASSLQLYLDLSQLPGRGAEAAQEILERELRPTW